MPFFITFTQTNFLLHPFVKSRGGQYYHYPILRYKTTNPIVMKNLLFTLSICMAVASCKKSNTQLTTQPGITQSKAQPAIPVPVQHTATATDSLLYVSQKVQIDPDKELYAVINVCLTDKRVAGHVKEITGFLEPYNKNDIKGILKMQGFTNEDVAFIRTQANNTAQVTIDTAKLKRTVKIVSHNDYKGRHMGYSYSSLTRPVFNKDYTRAVIDCNTYCGGLCGGGIRYALQKSKGGNWEVVNIVPIWES